MIITSNRLFVQFPRNVAFRLHCRDLSRVDHAALAVTHFAESDTNLRESTWLNWNRNTMSCITHCPRFSADMLEVSFAKLRNGNEERNKSRSRFRWHAVTMTMTMTHSEKSFQQPLEAWPCRHEVITPRTIFRCANNHTGTTHKSRSTPSTSRSRYQQEHQRVRRRKS